MRYFDLIIDTDDAYPCEVDDEYDRYSCNAYLSFIDWGNEEVLAYDCELCRKKWLRKRRECVGVVKKAGEPAH